MDNGLKERVGKHQTQVVFVRCHSDTIPKLFHRVLLPGRLCDTLGRVCSVQFRFLSRNELSKLD